MIRLLKKRFVVSPDNSLLDARSILLRHRISRLIVSRNDKPVGIITHRDFIPAKMPLWIKQYADPKEVENFTLSPSPYEYKANQLSYLLNFIAADIMTLNPVVIEATDDVSTAAFLMIRHGISGTPVVKNSILVGIITKTDIVKAIAS